MRREDPEVIDLGPDQRLLPVLPVRVRVRVCVQIAGLPRGMIRCGCER
jgi:hypothetical protein